MFESSARKKITEALITEMEQRLENFYHDLLSLEKGDYLPTSDFDAEQKAMIIRKQYLDSTAHRMFNRISKNSKVAALIKSLLKTPSKCGYDFDFENGISAGAAYAIAYFVLTHRVASGGDCIALNRHQNNLMDSVLEKVDKEIPCFSGIETAQNKNTSKSTEEENGVEFKKKNIDLAQIDELIAKANQTLTQARLDLGDNTCEDVLVLQKQGILSDEEAKNTIDSIEALEFIISSYPALIKNFEMKREEIINSSEAPKR